nr:hypothetical protein RTCK_02211 [Rhizobium sp. TCK]
MNSTMQPNRHSNARADLFNIVSEIETFDCETNNRKYLHWAEHMDAELLPNAEIGKLDMTDVEMRWVILDAIRRQVAEAQDPVDIAVVDDENLIAALTDNGFCPALHEVIINLCDAAMKNWIASGNEPSS